MRRIERAKVERAISQGRASGDGWVRSRCPFCVERTGKEDRRGAFSFNTVSGWCLCFKCGLKGRVEGFENAPIVAAEEEREFGPDAFKPPESFVELAGDDSFTLQPARDYLTGRGVPEAIWKQAHVGACWKGRYAGRVVFPILAAGEWLGFISRLHRKAEPGEASYLYPEWLKRKNTLYNFEALHVVTDEPVIVVEGALDALAYWPDSVAVLGKPSQEQTFMLADTHRPVAVVMDGDAWAEGMELSLKLQLEGQRAGFVRLPPRTDPDEVDRTWLREEARRCING